MALICLARFPKCSSSLIFLRLLNHRCILQKSALFSTSEVLTCKRSVPVKYTTNKASSVQISETIGLRTQPENKPEPYDYRRFIIVGGIVIFLLYFCILREENDIDEIMKGNSKDIIKAKELYDLKIKLKYCEQNNLPKDALKAKIEELEKDKKITSPFIK